MDIINTARMDTGGKGGSYDNNTHNRMEINL